MEPKGKKTMWFKINMSLSCVCSIKIYLANLANYVFWGWNCSHWAFSRPTNRPGLEMARFFKGAQQVLKDNSQYHLVN